MLESFETALAGRLIYGEGRLAELGTALASLAGARARVLLVSDRGLAAAGIVERTSAALAAAGFAVAVSAELAGEPGAADVDRAAAVARAHGAAAVVAIGGGSALDVGKLAAAIASAERPAADYALMRAALPERRAKLVLVPTTAGTGSEATRTSVFAACDGRKLWAWGDALRADLALLDPALTRDLPRGLTVATGVDALVHAIEAATARRASPLGDAFALHAIRMITASLPRAAENPADLEARGRMLVAAHLAGLAIDLAGTGVAHALGHALGTIGKVHHGRAVGHALRAALAWNSAASPVRYAAVARALGVPEAGRDETALAAEAAAAYAAFLDRVGLPRSLADCGLGPADADRLAAASLAEENAPMRDNNARSLARTDMERLAHALLAPA